MPRLQWLGGASVARPSFCARKGAPSGRERLLQRFQGLFAAFDSGARSPQSSTGRRQAWRRPIRMGYLARKTFLTEASGCRGWMPILISTGSPSDGMAYASMPRRLSHIFGRVTIWPTARKAFLCISYPFHLSAVTGDVACLSGLARGKI